jgi:MFS family permease
MPVLTGDTATDAVERRLHAAGVPIETAVALMGCLIILVADAMGLSLIPLVSDLEKVYGLTPEQATWTLTAPGVVAAGCIPTFARLGDRFGMRQLVLISLAISLVANLACAEAGSFAVLVTARGVLGMSAALPLIYAILRARGTSERRTTRGVAMITLASGVGVAVAYLMSGFIIQAHGGVREVFWALTAMSAVTLVVAWWILPDARLRSTDPIDWAGALGVSLGLLGIVLAITEGNSWGWSSASILVPLIGGLAILAAWAGYEIRQRYPLIDLRRVGNRVATPSFLVVAVCGAMAGYTNLAQATYVQMPKVTGYGLGLAVLPSAYILCVIAIGEVVGGTVAGPTISRFGPRAVMFVGSLVIAGNFVVLANGHSKVWNFVLWDAVWGFAFVFVYSAANAAFLADAKPGEAAMYVSANTVVSAAVSGIGPAIFVAILTSRTIPHTPIPDPVVFTHMWVYAAVASVVMAAIALLVPRPTYVPSSDAAAGPGADRPLGTASVDPSVDARPA